MSTLKSSAENLTLNADGSNNDVIIQSNGSTIVTVDGSASGVGIGTTTPSAALEVKNTTDGSTFAFQATNDNDHEIVQIGAQADGDGYLTVHGQGGTTNIKALITSDGESHISGGDLKIGSGDIFFETAGKGICLGVTSNTDANTLDDYEEGTFSPSFGADNQGFTVGSTATATGKYVKVGSLVHFSLYINLQSSTPNGYDYAISGLPFTSVSSHYSFFPIGGTYSGGNANALHDKAQWRLDTSGTTIKFYVASENAVKDGNEAWGGSSTEYSFYVAGSYTVAF